MPKYIIVSCGQIESCFRYHKCCWVECLQFCFKYGLILHLLLTSWTNSSLSIFNGVVPLQCTIFYLRLLDLAPLSGILPLHPYVQLFGLELEVTFVFVNDEILSLHDCFQLSLVQCSAWVMWLKYVGLHFGRNWNVKICKFYGSFGDAEEIA